MIYMNGSYGRAGRCIYDVLSRRSPVTRVVSRLDPDGLYCDLMDPDPAFCDTLGDGDSFVFLGAYADFKLCARNPEIAMRINVDGTGMIITRLLERGVRVLFFSSSAVYGEGSLPFKEDAPFKVSDEHIYANTKKLVEERFNGHKNFKAVRLAYLLASSTPLIKYFRHCRDNQEQALVYKGFQQSWVSGEDLGDIVHTILSHWDEAPPILNITGTDSVSKVGLAELYKKFSPITFEYACVDPPAEYLKGRDGSAPLSAERLIAFYGKAPHSVESIMSKLARE